MDNYGQVNKGQLWVQTVSSLPSWTSADVGRILLDTTSGDLYYSNSAGWIKIGGAGFIAGVKMYFYQNAAPAGWAIDTSVSDRLIGVKGGVSYYNIAGGNIAGTWTQPTHTHTGSTADTILTVSQIPSHYHELAEQAYQYAGTHARSWTDNPAARFDNATYRAPTYSTGGGLGHNHALTGMSSTSPSDVWRPAAAVGIIATKS